MRAAVLLPILACALPASARAESFAIGAPLVKEGMSIAASWHSSVTLDHGLAGDMHLQADIRATRDEAHGFAAGAWIPYLAVSYALTKDGAPTFKKSGLLYPVATREGPRYGGFVQMSGPGTYHLTCIISPPSSHGMLRQTGKDGGVPDWWKPVTADWTFTTPSDAK